VAPEGGGRGFTTFKASTTFKRAVKTLRIIEVMSPRSDLAFYAPKQ